MVGVVTAEVVRNALVYAAEEMGIVLRNSAYSPNIRERMDHSCAVLDAERRLVAQAEHIPTHLGSLPYGVRAALKAYGEELREGDMLLVNDPYIVGTHLCDLTLIAPVFYGGELVAYVANKAHHSDIGGIVPGSLPADATELFHEGLVLPPVRLVKGGQLDGEILSIILSNARAPEMRKGDLRAQIAANLLGAKRIRSAIDAHGLRTFREAVDHILEHSERRVREEIRKLPKGVYRAEDYMESTSERGEAARIVVAVTIGEDFMRFDYTGTDAQVEGPANSAYGVTLAGVYYVMNCILDPLIPVNEGKYRPVEVYVPPGTILNPSKPAPVGGGTVETSQRNVDVLLKALSRALPDRIPAASQGTMNNVCVGGVDEWGRTWTFYETVGGGSGAGPGVDGVDAVHVHMTNTMNTPIEVIEQSFPIRVLKYKIRTDTGGPGRWRGGCGIERVWRLEAGPATLSIQAERTVLAPWGLSGGREGGLGEYLVVKPDGRVTKLNSKCTVRLERGDIVIVKTPGGGGYGDPLDRDPELVLEDVLNGYVSIESARRDYGVVIDESRMEVDREKTGELRRAVRAARS